MPDFKKNLILALVTATLLLTTLFIAALSPLRRFFLRPKAANGTLASLSLNLNPTPSPYLANPNTNISLPIYLNTDGASIQGVDVAISYDSTILTLVSIDPEPTILGTPLKTFSPTTSTGVFNPNLTKNPIEFGVQAFDWNTEATTTYSNSSPTRIASLNFLVKPLAPIGSSTNVSFVMSPNTTIDTNIILPTQTDLLNTTSQVSNATITIIGSSPTITPTAAATGYIEAETCALTLPMTQANTYISQLTGDPDHTYPFTTLSLYGIASCPFTIPSPGNYRITAKVNAPDDSANSFIVQVDTDPTSPNMIWDFANTGTTGFADRFVTWRNSVNSAITSNPPQLFPLTSGSHHLVIRGREPNAQLDKFKFEFVSPLPTPTLPADTLPPVITFISPTAGSTVSRNSPITLSATASDNTGITQVNFLVNNSTNCTLVSPPYNCSWNVPAKPNATYTLTAIAFDAAGHSSSSSITVVAK